MIEFEWKRANVRISSFSGAKSCISDFAMYKLAIRVDTRELVTVVGIKIVHESEMFLCPRQEPLQSKGDTGICHDQMKAKAASA